MPARLTRHISNNVVGYLALFVALGGSGYAAVGHTSASDPTIHGCYKLRGGALRVVTSKGHKCAKGERALSWNKQGVNGSNGSNGSNGAAGANGLAGAKGLDGVNGLDGAAVAARARLSGPAVDSGHFQDGTTNDVPLTGNTWTQKANETDIIVGHINYDSPPPANCPGATGQGLELVLFSNGTPFIQLFMFGSFAAGTNRAIPNELGSINGASNSLPILPEPGVDTPRTLTVRAQDNCPGTPRYTIHALDLDVIRVS